MNKSGDNKKDDADASDDGESDSKANEDKNVSAASENGKIATVADTDTTRTIRVGETITLDSRDVDKYNYSDHNWTVKDNSLVRLNKDTDISITITGLKAGRTTVTDTYTSGWGVFAERKEKKYNIEVLAAISPTAISITGADKVTQFKTTQLKANLTPADASGNVTWTSSNEQILSVNDNGLVTAKRQGSATVTASVQGTAKATLSATKTIEVVKNESPTNKREALVYYLKDPTKDANSNATTEWGPSSIGTAVVNVEGATWTGEKNCFDNVDQRVVSWPTTLNGNVIPRSNDAWQLIFDAYKTKIERELRVAITEDDVEEISLVPAKISKNNGTTPDMHLDCNVNIKCKKVALIKYYLFDANGTNWEMLGSKNYLVKDGSTTKPSDVTNKSFPTTKTVNGVTYTFSGWYTDQSLTTPAPSFPAQVTGAANYYAKYVAGYQVMYNLAGGKFSDNSTTATEKHNVDTDVVVKEQPTRAGYKFKGWKVEGLSGTTTINSGDTFTMPNGNVTLTAQWEKKDIKDYVTLNTKDVTEVYNGQSHAAGEATAVAKKGKENEVGTLTVEYQKADKSWTTNRREITAKDVSDSKTVNVRVTSTDLVGELTGTEKLTITKCPVTLTSASDSKTYDGTPLTNDSVTAEGFVGDEGVTTHVNGSQTNAGSSKNTFAKPAYEAKAGTDLNNYDITTKEGTLTVNPVEKEVKVKITGHTDTVTYDGNKHEVTGYDVSIQQDGKAYDKYTTNDFEFKGTAKAEGTDAKTSYQMGLEPEQFTNKSANFTNVTFVVTDGSLTINKRPVTLTSASATKMYDGNALRKEEVTATGFVGKDGATYSEFASRTDVGTTKNTFEYALKDGTIPENYDIKVENGTLKVTPSDKLVTVYIKENSGVEKYDGTEKTVTGYEVTKISNKLYKEGDFSFNGKAEVKGTDAGTYNMELKPEDFTNTNNNFSNVSFVIEDGTLTIAPRNVTLTSASKSKAYDGKPLTDSTVTVSGDGFAEGEGATYNVTGSQTNVGTSDNTFTYTLNDGTKKDNYNITPVSGKLTVTKDENQVVVTITEKSNTVKYNGKEHTVEGYDVTSISNSLYKKTDFTFNGNDEVKGTNAGTYNMELKPEDFTNTNENFKDVKFNIVDGKLTIEKRTVVMTSASQSKIYDGKALENKTVTETGDGFIEGEGATYDVTGSQTNVGKSANEFTYDLNKGTDKDNYTIETHNGELEVTPITDKVTVTIKENSGTVKYDGAPHEVTGYTVKSISNTLYTANDFTFSGKAEAKGTDAGTYNMEVKASDFKNISNNFSDVEFVVEDGKLTIEKRKVTLTSANDKKVYDGTALTNGKVTVGEDGFAENEGATYKVTGTQTNVGKSDNEFTYTLNEGTKAANYTIDTKNGELEVTPVTDKVTVTIEENSDKVTYDGAAHKVTGYEVKNISNTLYTANDFTFSGKAEAKGTDAGTYEMKVNASDFKNISKNFSDVEFVVKDGKLTIEKRKVTLTSASDEKVYDGEALTNNTVTVGGDGFADGEGATYDVTGTITNVGKEANAFTYTLNEGTNVDNYDIDKTEGTLKVTPVTTNVLVKVKENGGNETYDGSEKTVKGYTVTSISNGLYTANDFEFTGTAKVSGTDAGEYNMNVNASDFKNISKNFTNVTFEVEDNKLIIAKRNVKLTSASDSKVYNGKALTNDKVTVGGDGFADKEGAEFTVTGSQTEVGESDNEFTYKLKDGTKKENYNITKSFGKLVVTASAEEVTVTIKGNAKTVQYDGTEKTVEGYTVENISNELYKASDFTFSGNKEVKGTDAGTYAMNLKAADFKNTNKNFSKVTFVVTDGKLEITKRNVTLKSASASKEYDGNKLVSGTVSVTGDGFADGEGATYDVTGSQTNVGKSDNEFTYTLNEGTKVANYDIKTEKGTLEVTPVTSEVVVTVTENSKEVTYDGEEKSVDGYKVKSISNDLYTADDFRFNGKAEVNGTDAGTYDMEVKASDFENISNNFSKVKFVVENGQLVINKRNVTLTSANDEKVYDGTALTNGKVTVGGDDFADGEGATYDVTGTITDVGEKANAFTYKLNKGTNADNYDIEKTEGTLKVTPVTDKVTVKIKGHAGTFKYDGDKKKVEGYDVTIDNDLYKESDINFKGTDKVEETNANTYAMGLAASDFKNISKNFSNVVFEVEDGQLVIEKRNVKLTSATDSKVYDGEALTNDEVTVGGDKFAKGEGATYDVTGTITNKGSVDNAFTYKLNDNTNADNYNIEVAFGKLSITADKKEVVVTITENSGVEKYDGTAKNVTGYKVTNISNKLYKEKDFTFSGNAKVEATDAGTYDMKLKPEDFANTNENFDKVTFVIVDGTLEIQKRSVTLTSADASQVYNGKALTNDTVTVGGEGFAKGEGATYDVTGTITNVGEKANTFTYKLNEGTKVSNYVIETAEGTLKVTPVTDEVVVNVKENSGKEKYDGTEKTVEGYKVTNISNNLYKEADIKFNGNAKVSGTDAGTYDMDVKATDFENTSKNFSKVKFVVEDGQLIIEKRNVTLTSADDENVYDGKALTNDKVTVGGEGFAKGEGATYDVTGTQTNVGESKNTFTYKLNEGTKTDNYVIETAEGTLKVTPVTDEVVVTITGNVADAKYDGKDHTAKGYKVDINNKLYTEDDFTFNGEAEVTGTDAGTYRMDMTSDNFTNNSNNFANVKFVVTNGELNIAKRNVTLTSESDSKAYDGKALTNDEVKVGGDEFAEGEGAEFTVTGSQLDAGTSDNVFEYALKDGTNADNYTIEVVYGKLTVTADENEVVVTITENRGRNKYDGRKHKVTGYEVTAISNKLYTAKDFTFNGKAEVTGTDAGTYNMNVKAADFENTNANFDKVTFVIIDGTLTIEKRNVTMTSANASKQYDGNALTSKKVTVSGEGFAKGEGATYDVTGTRTNTGTSKNTFTYTLKNGTKAANYNIKKVEGKLTITAAPVKPNTQNTPTNPTPQNRNVVQRVVTSVRNVPSRIARAVQETGAKVRELVNAGDNNVPLGNQKLDDHKCCVLHFLIMLLTAILYGFFTHNLKKRQKKLFEVREELDTELAKRGLPTTKEQKQQ